MTAWIAPPSDSLMARRERVVAAALRAAYAWSVRHEHPSAMREISRMTGVIMEAHGPGRGPNTPTGLAAALRLPLGRLPLLSDCGDDALAETVLLESDEHGDRLSGAAQDLVCEYAMPLRVLTDSDAWLPSWTRTRADQIKHLAFTAMMEAKDQEVYVTSRRFLIEHPAGSEEELQELVSSLRVRLAKGGFRALAERQRHRVSGKSWWWACPECRWPMSVDRHLVQCRYRPHAAVYQIADDSARTRPRLVQVADGPLRKKPKARPAEGARCVDDAVWRFIVVPGVGELRVKAAMDRLKVDAELWPCFDSYDLRVNVAGSEFRIDVKEYRSVHRLISDLKEKPPVARVLLPKSHEHQREAVRRALPSLSLTTETRFLAQVKRLHETTKPKKEGP